jgi:hypothetical protein
MKPRWIRLTLIGTKGLLPALWVLNVAHHLSGPRTDWSAGLHPPLLITLVAVTPGLELVSASGHNYATPGTVTSSPSPVPEPGILGRFGLGFAGVALSRRRLAR